MCLVRSTFKLRGAPRGGRSPEQGRNYYEERYRQRVLRALQSAAKLGMQMVPIPQQV